jgi:hypothetical protein
MNSLRRTVLPAFAIACLAGAAAAQSGGGPYRVDPATIASGGGTASGGTYHLSGTLGQPAAVTLSGSSYVLHDGFWGPASDGTGDAIFADGFDL